MAIRPDRVVNPRIVISAYSAEPGAGSESGAGYSIVRAAASFGEVWLLTRANNVSKLSKAFEADPPEHPVHLIPLEVSERTLALKRRSGAVRLYYALWQREAARRVIELDRTVDFSLVHHATMSAFWMPMGVSRLTKPLVVGPISGGTFTPRPLLSQLGVAGLMKDTIRYVNANAATFVNRDAWRVANVVLVQNREMERFASSRLRVRGTTIVQSHAASPTVQNPTLSDRQPLVLFVGRLVTWKGVLLALEAFSRLNHPRARLLFVGEGPARNLIERKLKRLNLEAAVTLVGALPRPEVLALMSRASCLLFPSFHDSAGFAVSEALALGLPVVCLDHGGPGQLTRTWSGTRSVAVKPTTLGETTQALTAGIHRFVEYPEPIRDTPVSADQSLASGIIEAYERTLSQGTTG
jgi:glycosyltransferase involved in cell wall biosynthesis